MTASHVLTGMSQSFVRGLCNLSQIAFKSQTENIMKTKVWIRPEVEEIHLGCEINSSGPAEN